jgi:hypothetical protein
MVLLDSPKKMLKIVRNGENAEKNTDETDPDRRRDTKPHTESTEMVTNRDLQLHQRVGAKQLPSSKQRKKSRKFMENP